MQSLAFIACQQNFSDETIFPRVRESVFISTCLRVPGHDSVCVCICENTVRAHLCLILITFYVPTLASAPGISIFLFVLRLKRAHC